MLTRLSRPWTQAVAQRRRKGRPGSMPPEASPTDARSRSRRCGVRLASAACVLASVVSADPVRIDVIDVRIEEGHAVLTLSREHSTAWYRKFAEVTFGRDFFDRVPEGWQHRGRSSVTVQAFDLYGTVLRIRNVPSDEASFRKLMGAVRYALEQTNAAEPAEDPPIADSSLMPVLEEVFPIDQGGVPSEGT